MLLLTNFAVGPRLSMASLHLWAFGWFAPSKSLAVQGLMFFASSFDRVPNGDAYEIHYEAHFHFMWAVLQIWNFIRLRTTMRVIVNCEIVNFYKDPRNARWCATGKLFKGDFSAVLKSTSRSDQAKDLLIAAGFVLCFLWVYDFSNAMRVPQPSALVLAYQMM